MDINRVCDAGTTDFWQLSAVADSSDPTGTSRKLLAASGLALPDISLQTINTDPLLFSPLEEGYSMSQVTHMPYMHDVLSARSVQESSDGELHSELTPIPHAVGSVSGRSLKDSPTQPFRNNIDFALHVVFYNENRESMLNPDVIAEVKAVEDSIFNLPRYTRLCLHSVAVDDTGAFICRRPISYTNVVYGRFDNTGRFIADGSAEVQQDPVKSAQVCFALSLLMFLSFWLGS